MARPTIAEMDHFRRLITGTSASREPAEWAIQLDSFTRRNRGRRAVVEVDGLAQGAQVLESGYRFQGVTFDPHDERVALMLGDGASSSRHVIRGIGNVQAVAIARFMTQIERRVPNGLSVHVILYNYATRKTPEVATRLRKHPRVHFHFTPTSASWLNVARTQLRVHRSRLGLALRVARPTGLVLSTAVGRRPSSLYRSVE